MAESVYRFQLVKANRPNEVVSFAPGGPHEMDLVQAIMDRVRQTDSGWFRSQATVETNVETAVKAALWDFKLGVQP